MGNGNGSTLGPAQAMCTLPEDPGQPAGDLALGRRMCWTPLMAILSKRGAYVNARRLDLSRPQSRSAAQLNSF